MRNFLCYLIAGCVILFACGTYSYPAMSQDEPANLLQHRSESGKTVRDTPSIYICQNYNWQPPCLFYPLGPSENDTQLFWMAPEPGGPGPYQDGNYTIGSWGPSDSVTTYWRDQQGDYSEWYDNPGTGQVDDYWKVNVWTFYAFWDE